MKLRIRQHEFLFFSIFALIKMLGYFWQMVMLTPDSKSYYEAQYITNGFTFNYTTHILLPQAGSLCLLYVCYLLVNWLIVPFIRQLFSQKINATLFARIAQMVLYLAVISYVFALGINIATYYAHPHLLNYGPPFFILSWLGYNDEPLTDLFAGVGPALAILMLYVLFAGIREGIIYYLEKADIRRAYKILISNQFTASLLVYLLILAIFTTFGLVNESIGFAYLFCIPSVLLVFMSNTYSLFPLKESLFAKTGSGTILPPAFIVRLLLSTLLFTLPFIVLYVKFVYQDNFLLILFSSWAFQLFIVTPLSWVLYQQRKDKILQLRGIQTELVTSKAHMQFLQSQINPHFLFNALNTLYGTALIENSDRTAEGIQKLGDMMRFMLQENTLDFIPLSREIEYLKNYISLQKLRTQSSPHILIEEELEEKHYNHQIAPMLLIPFIENAFKHGISLQEKSWIKIELKCNPESIRFEVRNSLHAVTDSNPEKDKSGIGLTNMKERLMLLYPGRYQLKASENGKEFIAQLHIQLSTRAQPVSTY